MFESLYVAFAEHVQRSPESIAVVSGADQVTYAGLDARARRVAAALRARGVGPDTLVGLSCERGVGLIAGLLGILAAGGAYLPLDPAYPAERVDYLLADSGAKIVVGSGPVAERLATAGLAVVDDDPEPVPGAEDFAPGSPAAADDLAYVIYTSGSTGAPKGVAVEHGNVLRLFAQTSPWFEFDDRDVWTWFHSASFDFSVWEIFGALLHGGRLVVVPASATRVPAGFAALLAAERVSILSQTPSAFRQLIAAVCDTSSRQGSPDPDLSALRLVVFGGERLNPALLRPWIDRFGTDQPQLVNMYGITETTVHVTYRRLTAADLDHPERSPIGVPIPDLRVTLHDPDGAPVPAGRPGQIWVAGPGVARGYLNRPELTAERFAVDSDGVRAYRSGDLAVRTASGDLEVLGRVDDQIKVRGFRIEPFEIESTLAGHPAVAAAVVAPRDYGDGDVRLVAHVRPARAADAAGPAADRLAEDLRAYAAGRLPAHLRPSTYELLKELPMTSNGKVDRALLRDREPGAGAPDASALADQVARIAEAVLDRGALARDLDLFDLGATSLAFVRIVAGVNDELGIALTGAELGEIASITRLAAAAAAALDPSAPSAV
ncbi:amino acid adenylation domain-containing protein [Catenulispora acidiphila]|nr:amino acid adenylation domain-containing protein [Catenulispora acidiphila]